jgi:hypothetical protein
MNHNDDNDDAQNGLAVLEFLSTFHSVTSDAMESMDDLTDGVALFEALSEMYVRLLQYFKMMYRCGRELFGERWNIQFCCNVMTRSLSHLVYFLVSVDTKIIEVLLVILMPPPLLVI